MQRVFTLVLFSLEDNKMKSVYLEKSPLKGLWFSLQICSISVDETKTSSVPFFCHCFSMYEGSGIVFAY